MANPAAELARGGKAFWAAEYAEAALALDGLPARLPRNADYAAYLGAESAFYSGAVARARALYDSVSHMRGSRFATVSAWRVADCLWAEGKRADAGAAYRRLLRGPTPPTVDTVVARAHLAELASGEEGRRLWRQIHVEFPGHPLAEQAGQRAGAEASPEPAAVAVADPRQQLRRAELLADGRRYTEAIEELQRLPPDLPSDLALERDVQQGMAKYHLRTAYPEAAALLLGAAPRLTGEKAAFAQFHGARALSRVDRDDQAIAEYRKVIERYPSSRWTAEAQFRLGWLDFNRGKFRESLPGLEATVSRYARTPFGKSAAWYLFLAHYLLDEPAAALPLLEQYRRMAGADGDGQRRVLYWRGRTLIKQGSPEGRELLRECARKFPFDVYGLMARSRLRSMGEPLGAPLETNRGVPALVTGAPPPDPGLQRADELLKAGLPAEAGYELGRAEESLTRRVGRERALALLLDRYPRMMDFHRAYQLAETRGGAALTSAPEGPARKLWEAAYPRAFPDLVERYAPSAGTPTFFVYSIMRKESGYYPYDVSYADARGLLQLIPAVGQQMSEQLAEPFHDDDLYQIGTNIRLGARYLGQLVRKFQGSIFLASGAYNGGVKAMMRWCDLNGRRPFDEFLELMTYDQTREYVKRVIGIYAHYLYLYQGEVYELPVTADARYTKDGPS